MIQYEAMEQEALFDWAAYNVGKYPELRLLYHIPNGGRRDPKEAAFLKRQGVKAGVPDLCLPVARGGYHGLYIELKYGKNKPTPEQRKWMDDLVKQGYFVVTCYGWEQAKISIEGYLEYNELLDSEKCVFCENLAQIKDINDYYMTDGCVTEYTSALITSDFVNGEQRGTVTYGRMPLRYCPTCGRRLTERTIQSTKPSAKEEKA